MSMRAVSFVNSRILESNADFVPQKEAMGMNRSRKCRAHLALLAAVVLNGSTAVAEDAVVFRHVNVVPMTQETVLKDCDVVVRDSKIAEIGPSGKVSIPEDAKVIEGMGGYLMPGLADMHIHLAEVQSHLAGGWPVDQLHMYLANGVTTVRDMHGSKYMRPFAKDVESGRRAGPAICGTAPVIWGWEDVPSGLVVQHQNAGYDTLKINSYLSERDFRLITRQAKKRGLYTVGHIPYAAGLDGVIKYGMDELAHVEILMFELAGLDRADPRLTHYEHEFECLRESYERKYGLNPSVEEFKKAIHPEVVEIARKVHEANIPVCTTLIVDIMIMEKNFRAAEFWARPTCAYFTQRIRDRWADGTDRDLKNFKGIEHWAQLVWEMCSMLFVEMDNASVSFVFGTDSGPEWLAVAPGFSAHDELQLLVEHGMSPYEAIATATKNAGIVAQRMNSKNEFGTIEVGKRADFILVNENPLKDVAYIKDNRGVMAAGKWYTRQELDVMVALDK
ncbi:MAG: amidohydrolase family protein [Phycisphaerales bacterium]|nr:MAG: amidohydrolase family protein [Phycisphaerales bacterium]